MKKSKKTTILTGYKSRQSAITAAIRRGEANVQVDGDTLGFYRVKPRTESPTAGVKPATWVYVQPRNWKGFELIPYREAYKANKDA